MRNPFNNQLFIEIFAVICPLKQKLKNCSPPAGSTTPTSFDRFASIIVLCTYASKKGILWVVINQYFL